MSRTLADELWFYRWLSHLGWPRSYLGKIFLLGFLANHLPLLSLVGYFVFGPANISKSTVFWLVLLATLADTTFLLWALQQLFKPLRLAMRALSLYLNEGQTLQLPTHFQDEAGLLLGNVGYAVQRFEQRRIALEQLASEDFLTGLLNRRAADDRLQQSLRLATRDGLYLGVAMLDVDQFKQINDHFGHGVGDQVLVTLSWHLKQLLRGSDWAARWGGEEFLIVLFSRPAGVETALERVRTSLARLTVVTDSTEVKFTVSIGYTMAQPNDQPQACVERADKALYEAKQSGRNCLKSSQVEVFDG